MLIIGFIAFKTTSTSTEKHYFVKAITISVYLRKCRHGGEFDEHIVFIFSNVEQLWWQ